MSNLELMLKPVEFFNEIIDSGMCNSIINGYIQIAFDTVGIKPPKEINHLIEVYSAEEARKFYYNS